MLMPPISQLASMEIILKHFIFITIKCTVSYIGMTIEDQN